MTRIWFISLLALLLIAQVCAKILLVQKQDNLIYRYLNKNDPPFTLEVNQRTRHLETSRTNFGEFPQAMNGQLWVKFEGDQTTDNVDATLKEYFSLISNDFMHPDYKLLYSDKGCSLKRHILFGEAASTDRFPTTLLNNAKFDPVIVRMDYIDRLRHIGNVIGMAILNKQVMDIVFDIKLYEMILGRTIHDFNVSVKRPFVSVKRPFVGVNRPFEDMSISGDKSTGGTFELDYFPQEASPETILSDRAGFTLTFSDKTNYEDALLMIIPQTAFTDLKFDMEEIMTLISGDMPVLNMLIWKELGLPEVTTNHPVVIQWFCKLMKKWDVWEHFRILSLITGISRLPVGLLDGHQSKPYIRIVVVDETGTVPRSDPYINTLYLPSKISKAMLERHFHSILENTCGAANWFVSAAKLRSCP